MWVKKSEKKKGGVKTGFLENFRKIGILFNPKKIGILFNQKNWGFFLIEKILFIFVCKKPEVLHEKLKTVLPMGILKKKISTPNFTKF